MTTRNASDSDLAIAAIVRDAARHITATQLNGRWAARFGDKVFLSAIWCSLEEQVLAPYILDGTFDAFKAWCCEANRLGILSLARADLVAAMYAPDVNASEVWTTDRGACFHFVRCD